MRKLSCVVSVVLVSCSALACGKKKPAAQSRSKGIALRPGLVSQAIEADPQHVLLLGVDAKGALVDYGELKKPPTITNGHVTDLPAGKPTNAGDLMISGGHSFVLLVDAELPANDVLAAVRSLDKFCWGFAVAAGDRFGVANPKPCPAGSPSAPDDESVQLSMLVAGKTVTFAVSRVNEVSPVAMIEDDVRKKLAAYKRDAFFSSCSDAPIGELEGAKGLAKDLGEGAEESGGTGTAMALEEGKLGGGGGCHVLIAFDDNNAKMGDVIDLSLLAMATGFTAPHWVAKKDLPRIDPTKAHPPEVETPLPPEVAAAKKKRDEAQAAVLAITKDTSKSIDDIKKAIEEAKKADEAYKAAKKKHKEAAGK